ncbi:MAG: Uma2 family endonuclease [Acidobacteria bacterium]|nr:MAG: Uma2 family endonuclease [Acidobacteriota bacterium]
MDVSKGAPSSTRNMRREEFLAFPEGPPDYEFEQGEAIRVVKPHSRHQKMLMRLSAILDQYVSDQNLGAVWIQIDVFLGEDRIYAPDIVYLAREHADRHDEETGKIHGAPDLVVEVISPHTVARDRVTKFRAYLAAGVPFYWLADPNALTLEEFVAQPDGYLCTTSAAAGETFRPTCFPGLEIDLQKLLS